MRPRTGPSSAQPTPTTAESFGLTGPSRRPDPEFHAYRQDLADRALAGEVIASHYADPIAHVLRHDEVLRSAPSDEAPVVCRLAAGDAFLMLDDSLGWAWGYAGADRRVGYISSGAIGVV